MLSFALLQEQGITMPSREIRRRKKKDQVEIEKTLPAERRRRHPLLYVGSIVLLVIIVIAFVGGPLVGRIGAGGPLVFGSYGGEEIQYVQGNYLARQVDILSDQLEDSGSQNYEWQAYQVWKGAYDRAVIRTAILQEAEKAGLYISDNSLDALLLTTGPYMENGVFSETRYRNTANSDRFRYRQLYREEMTQQLYIEDIHHHGFFSSAGAEFIKEMASDERSFNYVLFNYEEYPVSEVAAYADENASTFRKMKISRITIKSSLEEAETIRQQILDGVATFEDQARNFSADSFAEEGGDMGWQEYNALVTDFNNSSDLDAIFALNKAEVSDVYDTGFGWVFVRADESAVNPDLEDPEVIDSVRSYMERFERGLVEDYLLGNAESFAAQAKSATFEEAAGVFGVEAKKSASFPINYGNSFFLGQIQGAEGSEDLSGSAYDATFLTMLFSLDDNEISDPIVLNESVGVFQLAERTPLLEEDIAYLADYYPYVAEQNIEQDHNAFILASDEFDDNFTAVFSEAFLGQ
jgi:hypothetical protein